MNERTGQTKLRLLLPLTLSAASDSHLRACGRLMCQQKTLCWNMGKKGQTGRLVVMEVVGLAPEAGL